MVISMIDNTNNIYNTNTNIDNISIVVSDDSINIYNIYITINKYIYNTKKELKKLTKELDIKKGGPADVQAQQYDKPFVQSSMRIDDISEVYKQIQDIVISINNLKEQLNKLSRTKQELEETIKEVAKLRKDDLEIKVFIGHYIEGKRLIELSYELYRLDYFGRKQRYNYNYIRQINSNIKRKLDKDVKI